MLFSVADAAADEFVLADADKVLPRCALTAGTFEISAIRAE